MKVSAQVHELARAYAAARCGARRAHAEQRGILADRYEAVARQVFHAAPKEAWEALDWVRAALDADPALAVPADALRDADVVLAREICAKPGVCPCENPCRWATQALDDLKRDGWPVALWLVETGDGA
jgi:hypothetical protein